MSDRRVARDSMGEVQVPAEVHWGAQTQRAVENFTLSGQRFGRRFVWGLGLVKRAAARTNRDLGLLPKDLEHAISQAATEVATGKLDREFVVDVYQTGSGTSTNMNANEVIASRANEILGRPRGSTDPVHPNDHVNLGQSSNDVFPSAIHVAAASAIHDDLAPALRKLAAALEEKAHRLDRIVKVGRTHLADAAPVRLGQEISGWQAMVHAAAVRAESARDSLAELPLGGTAVGTGLNTHAEFGRRACARLAEDTGIPFREAANHFEAAGSRDACVDVSGRLKTIATSLTKISNDLRLLGSGPRCGIGEIRLPALQPGSSAMPGKVNPVVPEAVLMACARVVGNDVTIQIAGASGALELNTMMPVMAAALLESISLLEGSVKALTDRCIKELEADEERCREGVERTLSLVTGLVPLIGHEKAAALAAKAAKEGRSIREVALEAGVATGERLAVLLDPMRMTEPGLPGG